MQKTVLCIVSMLGLALVTSAWVVPTSSASTADVPPKGKDCWATHYGPIPDGAHTANGDLFDNNKMTAATSLSRTPQLEFGTKVKVTNVKNKKYVTVTINDRGTYSWTDSVPKCLDLTDGAFEKLGGKTNPDDGHIVVREQVLN